MLTQTAGIEFGNCERRGSKLVLKNLEPNGEHLWAIDIKIGFRHCAHKGSHMVHYWSQYSIFKTRNFVPKKMFGPKKIFVQKKVLVEKNLW